MMFWKRALAIAALALCCFAPAGASPPAAGDGAPKHFLWKVTGPKGVVYLLGTIHVGKADFYPLPSIIEDSFKKADTLIEEIDISEPTETARLQQRVIENGSYPNGDAITDHLSEVTRSHLAAFVKKGGLSEPAIAHMRPWLVSMLVMQLELQRMGFDPSNGLDQHFLKEAQQSNKPIGALEDAGSQLELPGVAGPSAAEQPGRYGEIGRLLRSADACLAIGRHRRDTGADHQRRPRVSATQAVDDQDDRRPQHRHDDKDRALSANPQKLFRRRRRRPPGRRPRHPEPIAAQEFQGGAALGSTLTTSSLSEKARSSGG